MVLILVGGPTASAFRINSLLFLKAVWYSVNIYPILILAGECYPLYCILKNSEMHIVIFKQCDFWIC